MPGCTIVTLPVDSQTGDSGESAQPPAKRHKPGGLGEILANMFESSNTAEQNQTREDILSYKSEPRVIIST